MFNESLIATTALSSFNNAALYSPFFFVVGLLTLPLLWIIYMYAHNFESKFGWNNTNTDNQVGFWSALFLVVWLMLCGGNYAVIRDGISLLPILIGFVLFVFMVIVTQKSIQLGYMKTLRSGWTRLAVLFTLFLMAAVSGYGTLWGVLVQISAVLCGIIVGFCLRKNISLVPLNVFMLTMVVVLVLMQPEFFRFGQLGNLTIVHLLSIVVVGFYAITALTTKYVHARNRIHRSAYIKLKWLFRIVAVFAFVLFILTESVPVFFGLIGAIGLSEMLTIYHSKNISADMFKQAFAYLLIWVGVILVCPALSGVGVLYLASAGPRMKAADFLALL